MQYMDRINAIEKRAKAVNLSLWRVCRRARVDYSRILSWRAGCSSPNVRTLEVYVEKLESELRSIECDLRQKLAVENHPAA